MLPGTAFGASLTDQGMVPAFEPRYAPPGGLSPVPNAA